MTTGQINFDRQPASFLERGRVKGILAPASCGLLWLIYLSIYLPFLPTAGSTIGHDYSLHFPNLLTGYFWFLHNGLSAIPWFSPSQCGGFAYFPDPNVAYFSVPQFLVFLVSPMRAIQLTFLLFSLIGLAGSYALMRHAFRYSRAAAVLAAGIFVFNGFFAYRMLIGHLTFHAFNLIPAMAVALLSADTDRRPPLLELVGRACVAAACLAYMFQSGMVHGIPPALLAITVILMIHGLCFGWRWQSWLLLAVAGAFSLALCAGKLVSELALLSSFPRDSYPLPGVAGLFSTLWVAAQTLFFSPPANAVNVLTNTKWALERHEWEYGVSAAPLVLVAAAAAVAVANIVRRRRITPFRVDRVLAVVTIAILLSIPIAVNWYQPDWNRFLKAAPYFGNSITLLRFFSAYIPVIVLLAGLALDRLPLPTFAQAHGRALLAVIGLGIVLLQNLLTDRAYYAGQDYKIAPIETAYAQARVTRSVPAIEAIGGRDDVVGGNDAMIAGRSQLYCYQPLFGYRLESFPAAPLQPGSAVAAIGQVINVKNPACYVFPGENSCRPGDHFTIAQVEEALAFLSYRPIAFEQPYRQQLATWLSLISIFLMAAALLAAVLWFLFARRATRGGVKPSAPYSSGIASRQSVLDRTRRNLVCSSLAIFVISLAFMLWGIAFYRDLYFDESWYIPTAGELLQSGAMLHQEHPPLGKLLITGSMWIFGDNPLGWRAMGAIFGSLTLVGMFFWSFGLFRNVVQSLWVTAITFFDQVLYVQARIATLDIFLMTFCIFALVFFTFSVKERKASRSLGFAILMGISLGLAIACKWSGLFLLFGIIAVKLLLGLLHVWRVRFEDPRETDFFSSDVWAAITPPAALLVLGLIPLLVYFVTYIPQIIHEGSIFEFVNSHRRMYEIMSGNPGTHSYSSLWFQWPAMTRPVWYLFHLDGNEWTAEHQVQAVVALVNPAILIAGEIAIAITTFRWISAREMNSMIVTVGFFSQYLPWAANPKGLEFSYYFFPSLLCLGPALGLVLLRPGGAGRNWPAMAMLVVAGLFFVFFLPILSAHVGVTPQGFSSRIWFQSWR